MLALDTNILVQLVTNGDPADAERIQVALDTELAARRDCMVGQIVLYELVSVLHRLYGYGLLGCPRTVGSLLYCLLTKHWKSKAAIGLTT